MPEIDIPFTNPKALQAGNFLTPNDVFPIYEETLPTRFEQFLEATGATPKQAGEVQQSFENVGESIKNFFGRTFGPQNISEGTSSNLGDTGASKPTSQEGSPSLKSSDSNGISGKAQSAYNSLLKNAVKGTAVVAGGTAAIAGAGQYFTDTATKSVDKIEQSLGLPNIEKQIGLPPHSLLIIGVVIIALIIILVLTR